MGPGAESGHPASVAGECCYAKVIRKQVVGLVLCGPRVVGGGVLGRYCASLGRVDHKLLFRSSRGHLLL